jgi:LmbE family N-acetylglucosaminyl deacetylase
LKDRKLEKTLILCFIANIISTYLFTFNVGASAKISISPILRKLNCKKIVDIYYIPHPDDETLSMGVAIANSVYNGNEVHLILLSDGNDSKARATINRDLLCRLHKKHLNSVKSGYATLSCEKFGKSRLKEFINASIDLGVKKKNINICNFPNEEFTGMDIANIILEYNKMYPGANHNTTSFYDDHKTHKKMGATLLRLYNNGEISHVRLFISPNKWSKVKGTVEKNPKINNRVIKSMQDYCIWNPQKSNYAIGYHSVRILFKIVREKLISKYNKPEKLNM